MKIIKNMVRRIYRWANEDNIGTSVPEPVPSNYRRLQKSQNIIEHNNGLNFTIFSATGGQVVQLNTYDPIKDRSSSKLYVITDKDNLGEELSHIITVECLSR